MNEYSLESNRTANSGVENYSLLLSGSILTDETRR